MSLIIGLGLSGLVTVQAAIPATKVHYLVYGKAGEPFQIPGKGVGTGVVTEIVEAVFQGSNVTLTPVVRPAKRINRLMVDGTYINWLTYGSRLWTLPEIKKKAVFSKTSLLPFYYTLVGLESSSLPDTVSYASLSDQTIITIFGYSYPNISAMLDLHGIHSVKAKSHLNAVKMLRAGRGDFYFAHPLRARWAIRQLGLSPAQFRFHELAERAQDTEISLLMDARMPAELRTFIEQRLQRMKENGRLSAIVARY